MLSLLVDATRMPSVDAAIFGTRPFVTDLVDYVCRNLTNIVNVVEYCCKNFDHDNVQKGIELLGNICCVFEKMGPTCRARKGTMVL